MNFTEMVNLVESFGFRLSRTDGSRHIFTRAEVPELVNLQFVKRQDKPYQIRQLLKCETITSIFFIPTKTTAI